MNAHDQQSGQFCFYPPRVSEEVDVTEQAEDGATRFVVRNRVTSRYFLLKSPEYSVFRQFDGSQSLETVAGGGRAGGGPRVSRAALTKFLTMLDSTDLLARGGAGELSAPKQRERNFYIRFHLFNPEKMLAWLDRRLGWALTKPFITASFVMMALVTFGLLARFEEVSAYTRYTYAEYGLVVILLMTLTITALHEFAHGLACKHFGGEVREVGVLMIYYVMPAFYCNVTDIYRLGKKHERLWVIFAGIYWQLLVSALGALVWMAATPQTVLADFTFLIFLGGTFNILINCNPLIKLDGYYALSQLLGVTNLHAQASAQVGKVIDFLIGPEAGSGSGAEGEARQRNAAQARKEKKRPGPLFYLGYWLCSLLYSVVLIYLILGWAGSSLMEWFGFFGVLLTLLLAALLTEKWWKPAMASGVKAAGPLITRALAMVRRHARPVNESGNNPGKTDEGIIMSAQAKKSEPDSAPVEATKKRAFPRRKVVKYALTLLFILLLIAPWEASTGSDCTLLLPPGRETVARANTDAVLLEIFVKPGDAVAAGAQIARLGNPEIEDRLTQLNSEIDRLNTNTSRIEDELRVRSEMLLSANFKEVERRRLAEEFKSEMKQIDSAADQSRSAEAALPPSFAVLKSEIELKETELEHNRKEVERYKKLLDEGLVGGQQYDRAVAAMRFREKEIERARARLEAAFIEHRRLTSGAETNSLVAETEARAARSSFEALISELHANRQQLESLKQRRDILQKEYAGMIIQSPGAGMILGEDMRKMIGRRYSRGEEICRVGELENFLLRIDVSERDISEVRLDSPVRFKLKTVPGRTFTGQVSKINAEPTPNQHGQLFYPVEVLVDNADGLLRPGMTGFARISFGRQSIGLIISEKIWQSLRPELWLF